MKDELFYTLKGYQLKEKRTFTPAMEDYIEMIYRFQIEKKQIHTKDLADSLHVKASSVTKMMQRLREINFVSFQKYGLVDLTPDGYIYGKYLLYRHECLVKFFQFLNKDDYKLEQVEKIEHFVDIITIENMEKLLNEDF